MQDLLNFAGILAIPTTAVAVAMFFEKRWKRIELRFSFQNGLNNLQKPAKLAILQIRNRSGVEIELSDVHFVQTDGGRQRLVGDIIGKQLERSARIPPRDKLTIPFEVSLLPLRKAVAIETRLEDDAKPKRWRLPPEWIQLTTRTIGQTAQAD